MQTAKQARISDPSLQRRQVNLCDRISHATLSRESHTLENGFWSVLERAAIRAVTAGGMAAMNYYRQALPWASVVSQREEDRNPSILADLEATAAILQTIDRQLTPIAQRLACSLSYLGEETEYRDWLNENLNKSIFQRVRPPERFFSDGDNIIRVIVDGIDGTVNFTRGIPCSAQPLLSLSTINSECLQYMIPSIRWCIRHVFKAPMKIRQTEL
jgi:hypothetical protein